MSRLTNKKNLLTQAVLASSLFVTPFAFATQFGGGAATPGPVLTSAQADNIVEVLGGTAAVAGQITGAGVNAVNLDSANGSVIVGAGNGFVGTNAILTTGAAAISGVNVTGIDGVITVGSGSGINANGAGNEAVSINAADAIVSNWGMIQSTAAGKAVDVASTGAIVLNNAGGIIQGGATAVNTLSVNSGNDTFTLNNAGLIQSLNKASAAINLASGFTSINNNAGGVIHQTGGSGQAAVLLAGNGGEDNFFNNAGATISADGNALGMNVTSNLQGSIFNAGLITTNTGNAVELNSTFQGALNNSGTIYSLNSGEATIFNGTAGTKIVGGLINSGNIVNATNGEAAIDLATNDSAITFTQNAGNVVGNVLLSKADSTGGVNVFTMNGGAITGNVFTDAGAAGSTLTLNGGAIAGTIGLNNGGDVIDVNGGNFGGLTGNNAGETINVNVSFTPNGTFTGVDNFNVAPGAIFTLNNPIFEMDGDLNIAAGAVFIPNANITNVGGGIDADINNSGQIFVGQTPILALNGGQITNVAGSTTVIDQNGVLTVTSNVAGAFINQAGSTLEVQVGGIQTVGSLPISGQLVVNSAQAGSINLNANSFVLPVVTGFIPQGSTYNIASVLGGGTIVDASTYVPAGSAIVSFTPDLNPANNILQLVADRKSFTQFQNQPTVGVAGALDVLAQGYGPNNQDLLNLLGQFDQLTTAEAVQEGMEAIVPPFNYGLVAGSHVGMDMVFDGVKSRVNDLHTAYRRAPAIRQASNNAPMVQLASNGINFGDFANGGSVWVQPMGAYLDQSERDEVDGYRVKAVGIALGADWGINDCTTVGLAGSYTHADVDDKNPNAKDLTVKSWQGTLYGQFEFMHGLYLDAMFGIASNDYDLNREINIGTLSAVSSADFDGTQIGLQGDLGWAAVNCEDYYFAPFARLKYVHLDVDDYTENGAGGLSLNVQNNDINEFLGGLGFKVGTTMQSGGMLYVPELTAMLAYDFTNDGEQTIANFVGGGLAFATDGVKPGRTIFNLGLGVDAYCANKSVFTLKYNLELRDSFVGNAIYAKYSYLFS